MTKLNTLPVKFLRYLYENDILEALVKKELLNTKLSKLNLEKDEEIAIKSAFMRQKNLEDDASFKEWINQELISESDLLHKISLPVKIGKYCKQTYSHIAHAHFLKRKSQLDKVVYSLIRVKDSFEAQEYYLRIKANECSFGEIAQNHSMGPEKLSCGIVGPVSIESGHPTLAVVLKATEPGQIKSPFRIDNWWLIVRVESFIEAKLDDSMENNMSNELFEIDLSKETKEMMEGIKTIIKNQNN